MRKLALSDALLLQVQRPARYIGNEMHAVYKGGDIPIRFAMCFPDVYEIGMSHLGIQILYELFNRRPDTWCERVFSPWIDMEKLLRDRQIPLFALESQDPVRGFDFLGFTLQFELCYTNILQVLDLSGIPLLARDRGDEDPVVIGGGPCACNPEPVADFFDLFYIGEGETSYDALLDLYRRMKRQAVPEGAGAGSRVANPGRGRGADGERYVRGGTVEGGTRGWPGTIPSASAQDGEKGIRRGWKADFLRAAAQIPGIYVPSLYEVRYREDGTIASFDPLSGSRGPDGTPVPRKIRRQVAADLDDGEAAPYPLRPLIPFLTVTQDRVAVELQRGCIRGCRFCQAGMIYRPNRERDFLTVKKYADAMLAATGQDDILLSSLSSSDYTCIREIVDHVSGRYAQDRVKLQVPSLRIDSFSLDLMAKVQDVRRSSLTFAPEAGSQRLRDVINKGLTEEDILAGAREAFRGGWSKVKLYFMLGLPTETEEDRVAISDLANRISAAYYEEVPKEKRKGRCQITVSTSFFVPKPFTPFQWARMYRPGDYLGYAATVNHAIYQAHNHRSIQYSWHEADGTYLEGVLARGDRRVSALILEAYRLGARFDCWVETWRYGLWEQAAANTGVDMDFYTVRERGKDEIFPWDFIDAGVRRDFLWREWEKAGRAALTPNCREACSGCGAASYGCGVCLRGQDAQRQSTHAAENPGAASISAGDGMQAPEERLCAKPGRGFPAGAQSKKEEIQSEKEAIRSDREGTQSKGEASAQDGPLCYKIRLRMAKYGPMKFIGHLELMRFLQKCIRRTDIDIRYSGGVTPRMIMSTAMPLGLGLESWGEYIDLELASPVTKKDALAQLGPLLPEGLEILDLVQVGDPVPVGGGGEGKRKPQKAMSIVAAASYAVRFREWYAAEGLPAGWRQILEDFVGQKEIPWTKETKKGFRTLDMRPLIYDFSIRDFSTRDFSTRDFSIRDYSVRDFSTRDFSIRDHSVRDPSAQNHSAQGIPGRKIRAEGFLQAGKEISPASPGGIYGQGQSGGYLAGQDAEDSVIYMCVCSRVGQNLRPEQLIGEAFRQKGYVLPEEALQICRLDLYAALPAGPGNPTGDTLQKGQGCADSPPPPAKPRLDIAGMGWTDSDGIRLLSLGGLREEMGVAGDGSLS